MKLYYFVDKDKNRKGPLPAEDLLSYNLTPDTLVYCKGMQGWTKAKYVPELAFFFVLVDKSKILSNEDSLNRFSRIKKNDDGLDNYITCGKNEGSVIDGRYKNVNVQGPYEKQSNAQHTVILLICIGLLVSILIGVGWWLFNYTKGNNINNEIIVSDSVATIEKVSDEDIILSLVKEWDKAINDCDYEGQKELYAPYVFFYTVVLSADDAVRNRKNMMSKQIDYLQYIKGTSTITRLEDGKVKVTFTKYTTANGEGRDYPSYLIFSKINGNWKIIKESDEVTDANVARKRVKISY